METISPDISNVSPPLTPFNIITPHKHILTPLKGLPTWNRTKLGIKRTTKTITKNKVSNHQQVLIDSDQLEQFTQTSPLSSRQSSAASSIVSPIKSLPQRGNLSAIYEKKIVFLQSTHGDILAGLHEELEILKSENKVLNFNLVMTRCDLEKIEITPNNMKVNNKSCEVELKNKVKSLEQQLDDMKSELNKTKNSNKQLLDIINNQKKNTRPLSSVQFKKPTKSLHANNSKKTVPRMRSCSGKKDSNEVEEVCHHICGQNSKDSVISNDKSPRSHHTFHKNENDLVLPRIEPRNGHLRNTNNLLRDTKEPITLPLLKPFPPGNSSFSARRKRTKALQIHKQRCANK